MIFKLQRCIVKFMEQPVEFNDVLQGEQARGINTAVEDLVKRFGEQINGNVYKRGVARTLPDGSKLTVTSEDYSARGTTLETVISHSVFIRNSHIDVVGPDRAKRKEPVEERAITRIVFSDGIINRFRKGIDVIDSQGCSEPKKNNRGQIIESPLLDSDFSIVSKAVSMLGEVLEAEKPATQLSPTRRFFQSVVSKLPRF